MPPQFTTDSNGVINVAKYISREGGPDDIFKEKIGSFSVREIVRSAAERHTGSLGYAETMLTYYNKKMKFGLQRGSLYTSQARQPNFYVSGHSGDADRVSSE